jgi:hypothetical protein
MRTYLNSLSIVSASASHNNDIRADSMLSALSAAKQSRTSSHTQAATCPSACSDVINIKNMLNEGKQY